MLGAIIGDIVGSRFEFLSTQEKNPQLFSSASSWTDDSVCTAAVARACEKIISTSLSEKQIEELFFNEFKKAIKKYPMAGYGKKFFAWSQNKSYERGDSAANGCLMRVSPIALYFNDLDTVLNLGRLCTQTSHNHPDSLRSVSCYLEILFYLKTCIKKLNMTDMKNGILTICKKYELEVDTLDNYHQQAGYWVLAKDTLPRAIAAYLAADNFLGTFSNIIYLGSDTDTTGTVAGSMAELTYGIHEDTLHQLYRYFDHKTFDMVHAITHPYMIYEEQIRNLEGKEMIEKTKELFNYKAVDPTAAYDPLEMPSDDVYYNGNPPPKNFKEKISLWWKNITKK